MEKVLSDEEIKKFIPTVMRYDQLTQETGESMLKRLPVVILYETKPNYGHWTLLHRLSNGWIEFFDSYGMKPDEEFKFIDDKFQLPHHLMRILKEIKDLKGVGLIHYNNYPLQLTVPGVNTCGRWVIARSAFNDIDIDNFANLIIERAKRDGVVPDKVVTLWTDAALRFP